MIARALIAGLLLLCCQVHATDLISCRTRGVDYISTLRVFETARGYGLVADVKPIGFSHADPYHSESEVHPDFVDGKLAVHFENDGETVFHSFGHIEYVTKDRAHNLSFPDTDCADTPGNPTMLAEASLRRGVVDCESPATSELVSEAQQAAQAKASNQCKGNAVRVTDFEIESHCKISVAEVKVSAVFRCEDLR